MMTRLNKFWCLAACLFTLIISIVLATDDEGIYKIGVGIADITGPPAGVVLNGHLRPTLGAGIATRQYAQAFVVESKTSGNLAAFLTCDMGMIDHSMKSEVVKILSLKHGAKFNQTNIMISATHTHSGVSGFMTHYAYLAIESYGFNPISYWAVVEGIAEAIDQATNSLEDGHIFYGSGELLNANRNRRSDQYEMNPETEKEDYEYNVDKEMIMLKLEKVDGKPIGAFFWYPLHPLSFNSRETNPLVSSEGNGYAALLFDADMNAEMDSKFKFVSGFGSSNLGDVSPNNDAERRIDVDLDMEKLKNLGGKLYRKAKELFSYNSTYLSKVTGSINHVHQYVDAETIEVDYFNETSQEMETLALCKPAMGFGYFQLDPEEFPFLEIIRDFIKEPSAEMVECQKPKVIAVAAGEMLEPWPWAPSTFELQVFQIGNVNVVGLPGEFTTMAGRRIRNSVESVTINKVILAGLCNNYINYVATPEEYDLQKYEAGATIYGRNTLPVITVLFQNMSKLLSEGNAHDIPEGEEAPSLLDFVREAIPPFEDSIPANGRWFGDVIVDVKPRYILGDDKEVNVIFAAGSPRNSPLRRGTFLTVEKLEDGIKWVQQRTDADIDTILFWNYLEQQAEITWFLGVNQTLGQYRIRHFGYYRLQADGLSVNYVGSSSTFEVSN